MFIVVKKNRASKHLQVQKFLLSSINMNVFAMFLNNKLISFFSATIYISLNEANVPLSPIISDIHLFYKFTKLNVGRHMASFQVEILSSISSILKIVPIFFCNQVLWFAVSCYDNWFRLFNRNSKQDPCLQNRGKDFWS